GGLEVDDQLELGALLDRQVGGLGPLTELRARLVLVPAPGAGHSRGGVSPSAWPLELTGSVKVNVEPLLTWLSTPIRPPCSSTNFFASVRPSPVPSCLRASSRPTWRNSSKMVA